MSGNEGLREICNVKGERRESGQRNKPILSKSRKWLVINVIFLGEFFWVRKEVCQVGSTFSNFDFDFRLGWYRANGVRQKDGGKKMGGRCIREFREF